jgi:predicted Zn-dependent peptidase
MANGMVVLVERMAGVQSATMNLLLPAGCAYDAPGRLGTATVVNEMTLRGAGERDSRQLTNHLDSLGLSRSAGVGVRHSRYACAAPAAHVLAAIPVYADIARRARMEPPAFEPSREQASQVLAGLEDDPQGKLMVSLRKWHLPGPYCRNPMGEQPDLQNLAPMDCLAFYRRAYQPSGAILSIAGNVDPEQVISVVEQAFGDWKAGKPEPIQIEPPRGRYHFELTQSEQTHIGLAFPTVDETSPDHFAARMAFEAFGGGTSSRLFTEVREKRGLCYSIHAGYVGIPGQGHVFGYAGTSNDRAQQTLDCFVEELARLEQGVEPSELERARVGLKASMIMQNESTGARAAAIAHDFFIQGRVRSLEEIKSALEAVTVEQVNRFLRTLRSVPVTLVIAGPRELRIPKGVT